MQGEQDVVSICNVSKKYCRNLQRSLRYGLSDIWGELAARPGDHREHLRRGEFFAVRDVTFSVRAGQCVALLGPNGAGKSTMLKMLCGLIKPDTGQITIRGRIGTLIELGTGFNPVLSGRENVYINAAVLGLNKRETDERFDEIVDFAELEGVINDPVKTYSSGMRVRLGFSVAAHLRPHLLLMDEVLAVGDVGFRMKCFRHLNWLTRQGVSIVLVTHAVGMLSRVSDRAIVFSQGKLVFDGALEPGIATYEQLMHVDDLERQNRDETAAQGAWIEQISVRNRAGHPANEFRTGDSLQLGILLCCEEAVRNARLTVALHSPTIGVVSTMSSPAQDFRFDIAPQGTLVRLTIPDLPLLIGAYYFNISLFGPRSTDFYQRRSNAGAFQVVGAPDASGRGIKGLVHLPHRWSRSAAPEGPAQQEEEQ